MNLKPIKIALAVLVKTLALTPPVNAQDTRAKTLDAGSTRLIEGGVFGAYFLPIWAGVDPVTGNELIYEVDQVHLNQTGLTRLTGNVLDATLLGGGGTNNHRMVIEDKSPHPTFFGGLSNTLAYKGLDFTFLFYFQAGNWILDEGERLQSYPGEQQSLRAGVRAGMTADGLVSNFPLVYDSPLAGTNTTRFLHDGSFIRLRNLQLGYTLPTNWSGKIGSQNLRFYVAGQNLLTFTRFPGWDPEVFSAGGNTTRANLGPGITRYDLPQVRTLLVGINIGF